MSKKRPKKHKTKKRATKPTKDETQAALEAVERLIGGRLNANHDKTLKKSRPRPKP
jgi:hypothetical protein